MAMKFSLFKYSKRRHGNDINANPLPPDEIISSFWASFHFEMIPGRCGTGGVTIGE